MVNLFKREMKILKKSIFGPAIKINLQNEERNTGVLLVQFETTKCESDLFPFDDSSSC